MRRPGRSPKVPGRLRVPWFGGARDATRALAKRVPALRRSQLRYRSSSRSSPSNPERRSGSDRFAQRAGRAPDSPEWAAVRGVPRRKPPSAPEPPAAPQRPARRRRPEERRAVAWKLQLVERSREGGSAYDGAIEFSDDDTDVKRLSPNGYFEDCGRRMVQRAPWSSVPIHQAGSSVDSGSARGAGRSSRKAGAGCPIRCRASSARQGLAPRRAWR